MISRRSADTSHQGPGDTWIKRAGGVSPGNRFFIWIITHLGLRAAYLVLVFAAIQYVLLDKKSNKAIRNFRASMGLHCSPKDLFRHYYAFGMSLIDRYFFLLSNKKVFAFKPIHEDFIENEAAKGHGVILLGAHVGNWELAGNLLSDRIKTPINFIMLDAERESVKKALQKATENRRASIIFVSPNAPDTMVEVVNALRKGEIVCFHGDRSLEKQRAETAMFLGRPAMFPTGPYSIAALTGAPVIPIFGIKSGWFEYTFIAYEPILFENVQRDKRASLISQSVRDYVRTLEAVARKHPLQWFNFYDFWAG